MILTNAKIYDLTDKTFKSGSLEIDNGIIKNIYWGKNFDTPECKDMNGALLMPGFVDAHTHGRNGFDFNTASKEEMQIMKDGFVVSA